MGWSHPSAKVDVLTVLASHVFLVQVLEIAIESASVSCVLEL